MTEDIQPTLEEYRTTYQLQNQIILWSKGQQWSVANWTILILGGIVASARTILGTPLSFARAWPFLGLILVVSYASGRYLRRLHQDLQRCRRIQREISGLTGFRAIERKFAPSLDERTDRVRGKEYLYAFIVAIAFAEFVAITALGLELWLGATSALVSGVINASWIGDA